MAGVGEAEEARLLVALKAALLSEGLNISAMRDVAGQPLADVFLLQCLRTKEHQVERALKIVKGFVGFRQGQRWPFDIQREHVLAELRSDVHWVIQYKVVMRCQPRGRCCRGRMRTGGRCWC